MINAIAAFGTILALGQIIYARAHFVVGSAPEHPAGNRIRWILALHEGGLVPLAELSLTYLLCLAVLDTSLPDVAVITLAMASITSFTFAVFLHHAAPRVRDTITRGTRSHAKLKATMAAAVGDDDSGSLDLETSSGPLTGDMTRTAVDEIRSQRRQTQALWDLPAALLLMDRDLCVKSETGGALRLPGIYEAIPPVGQCMSADTTIGRAVRDVLRTGNRFPFDLRIRSKTFSGVASPWVTMSGRIQGVTVLILASDEASQTDEDGVVYLVRHG